MKKLVFAYLVVLMGICFSTGAYAGGNQGVIKNITVFYNESDASFNAHGWVAFGRPNDSPASCASSVSSTGYFYFRLDNEPGKAIYNALLSAKMTNEIVRVVGAERCEESRPIGAMMEVIGSVSIGEFDL